MAKRLVSFVVAVCSAPLFLLGCEAPEPQVVAQVPQRISTNLPELGDGESRIVVYRGIGTVGLLALAQLEVKLDGRTEGVCRRKDRVVIPVAPGEHTLSMQSDTIANLAIQISAGQTAFVRCTMLPIGILLPAPALALVPPAEVEARVSTLPVQPAFVGASE